MGIIRYALRRYLFVGHQYPFHLTRSPVTCYGSREADNKRKDKGVESEHEGAPREYRGSTKGSKRSTRRQYSGVVGGSLVFQEY